MEGSNVLIHHLNGAVLPAGKYEVLVDGADPGFTPVGQDFTPGMTLVWDSGNAAVGSVSVVYKNGDESTLLAQKIFGKAGSGGGEGGEVTPPPLGTLRIDGKDYPLVVYQGDFNVGVSGKNNVYYDSKSEKYWIIWYDATVYAYDYNNPDSSDKLVGFNSNSVVIDATDSAYMAYVGKADSGRERYTLLVPCPKGTLIIRDGQINVCVVDMPIGEDVDFETINHGISNLRLIT